MDVIWLTVDFENGARLSGCKMIQRHNLAASSDSRSFGQQTLHFAGARIGRHTRRPGIFSY
jgi:hypothetical protein